MSDATQQQQQARSDQQEQGGRSFAEWVTFSVALAIVLALVGLILYDWLATPDTPPIVAVTPGAVRTAGDQFYVPFTLENTGGQTAEMVQVIAELTINGDVVEDGDQQIDFLSSGERVEGEFVFSRDPAEGELAIRVASYQTP